MYTKLYERLASLLPAFDSLQHFADFIFTPISSWTVPDTTPTALATLLNSTLDLIANTFGSDITLATLMFGTALTLFAIVTVVKWLIGIIT